MGGGQERRKPRSCGGEGGHNGLAYASAPRQAKLILEPGVRTMHAAVGDRRRDWLSAGQNRSGAWLERNATNTEEEHARPRVDGASDVVTEEPAAPRSGEAQAGRKG